MSDITVETIRKVLPRNLSSHITDDFVDKLVGSIKDKEIARNILDNFISYSSALKHGGYSLDEYMNAVKYVSYKLMDYNSTEAYIATFPDRYKELRKNGQDKFVGNYASMYNRGKLVNLIFEQTMIPTYVLNAPLHQEALNTLADIIRDDKIKGMVKVKACETILNYTKKPDVIKGEININMGQQSSVINELREVTEQLASTLQKSLTSGQKSLNEVTNTEIIDVDVLENKELVNG